MRLISVDCVHGCSNNIDSRHVVQIKIVQTPANTVVYVFLKLELRFSRRK